MADEPVLLLYDDGIATLTLNRPGNLNAASRAMMGSLESRLHQVAALPGLRVVILTGTGRAFCAGGDLIEFEQELAEGTLLGTLARNQDIIQMLEDLPVPVIGAANGIAVAGGLELLLACDIVIAAETARLGDGHARYAIVPAGGATVRLLERVSPGNAARLFYTAGTVDAGTAAAWGLVNEVAPADRLMERAMELAGEIAARSPEAVRRIKALTARGSDPARKARLRAEIESFAAHLSGADLAEGLAAFRAKRAPAYEGV
jgi:enoyl-CoA hydratase/carnithine racemase